MYLFKNLIGCSMNDDYFSTWSSPEFWRNAVGHSPYWILKCKLEKGALNYKTAIWGTFWLFDLLLSNTSTAHFDSISNVLGHTLTGLALLLDLPWYFNFRSIDIHQTNLDIHFYIYNISLNVWNTYFGWVYQNSGRKQHKLCFSVTKAETRSAAICEQYFVKEKWKSG